MRDFMDWTKISTDPNNREAMQMVHDHLLGIRVIRESTHLDWLIERVRGRCACLRYQYFLFIRLL